MSYGRGEYGRQHSSNSNSADNRIPTEPPFSAFVGNLPKGLIQGDIEKIFARQKVKNIRMLRDKETDEFLGRAFVEFYDRESLSDALGVDNALLEGRNIRVDVANRDKNRDNRGGPRDDSGRGGRGGYGNAPRHQYPPSDRPRSNFNRSDSNSSGGQQRGGYNRDYNDRPPSNYGGGRDRGGYNNYNNGNSSYPSNNGYGGGGYGQQGRYAPRGGSNYDNRDNRRGDYGNRGGDFGNRGGDYGNRGGFSNNRGGRTDREKLPDTFADLKVADPADLANRPKLNLQPRTVAAPIGAPAEISEKTRQIFGGAKPVDVKDVAPGQENEGSAPGSANSGK